MTDHYDELDDVVENLVRDLDDEPITIPEAEAQDMLLEDPFLSMLTVTARQALDGRGHDAAEIDLTAIVTAWVHPDMLPPLAAKAIVAFAAEQREHTMTDADLCAAKADAETAREQLLMMTRQRDLLRRGHLTTRSAEIQAAIADPGAIVPRIDDAETIPAWCARAVVAVLAGTQAPTPADDAWAALDEVLSPIVAGELARQADEQAKPQVLDLDTVLAALESDIAAMPPEDARAQLVSRVIGLETIPGLALTVDALWALADARAELAKTISNWEDHLAVATDDEDDEDPLAYAG